MNQSTSSSPFENKSVIATFKVVLNGLQSNVLKSEAKAKLSVLFKASPEQVEKLLETHGYVLRKTIPFDVASKYQIAIEKAGGVCEIVSEQESIILDFELPTVGPSMPTVKATEIHPSSHSALTPAEISLPVNQPGVAEGKGKAVSEKGILDNPKQKVWWYSRGGQQFGPVSFKELQIAVTTGTVASSDMAWGEGMPNWQPVASIEGLMLAPVPPPLMPPPLEKLSSAGPTIGASPMDSITDALGALQLKVSKQQAYLGVLIGFGVFAFALFLSWSSIPTGQMARDGGGSTGWSEKAYLAIFPLILALYPVFRQQAVQLKTLIINIAIAFGLLGYNNIINRSSWHNNFGNMGSTLDAGFWLGLLSMVAISVLGTAWALHTSTQQPLSESL